MRAIYDSLTKIAYVGAWLTIACSACAQASQISQSGVISGRVDWVDAGAVKAAVDVGVRLYPSGESPDAADARTTRTDSNGVYTFDTLMPGSYSIFVDGFVTVYYQRSQPNGRPIQLGAGQTISDIDFRLLSPRCSRPTPGTQTIAIVGKLTETLHGSGNLLKGYPYWFTIFGETLQLPGMPGFAPPRGSPAGDFAHSCNILIGTDGKFAIQGFSAGEYTIAVRRAKQVANSAGPLAPAYIGYATVRLIDKDAQVEIPIDETGEIAGKVVVTNPGEEIDAFKPFFVSAESRQLNIHSSSNVDDDGNFRLGPFPVGPPYTVNAGVTGRAAPPFYLKHVECDGQDYSNRTITIPPGNHVVNCTLTLANDRP